jgi:hypothetical protein
MHNTVKSNDIHKTQITSIFSLFIGASQFKSKTLFQRRRAIPAQYRSATEQKRAINIIGCAKPFYW